jgi:hypothetical protein
MKGNHIEYRKILTGKFVFRRQGDSYSGTIKLKKDPISQELTNDMFILRGS